MRHIANIITKGKLDISSFFNVTTSLEGIDTNTPTLIIGWGIVKELFPEQDILTPIIKENISWTFSKREKRYQYEKDIENFINNVVKNINNKINYRFFNFILATKDRRNKFISYIQSGLNSIYYNSNFLYIYNIKDNITIGISLNDLNYIGINTMQFLLLLNKNNNNLICENLKCITPDSYSLIKDNLKIVSYLNYLKNSDIYKENTQWLNK